MGLFQGKQQKKGKSSKDDPAAAAEIFFDETFREELKSHGRWYFEKVITENAVLFKQDLDEATAVVKTELTERMTKQLEEQLAAFSESMKQAQASALQSMGTGAQALEEQRKHLGESIQKSIESQEASLVTVIHDAEELALQSINRSAQALEEQHQHLFTAVQNSVTTQEASLTTAAEESKAHIAAMKTIQDQALQSLNQTVKALEEQRQQLGALLQQNVANQQTTLVTAFEENMAQIVEHYLLGALGDQYDLKAQIPSIIKQMEENKQAILEDVQL